MPSKDHRPLREALEYGYTFRFGDYLEAGFNLFGKLPGPFIGFSFVYMAIVGITSLIPVIGSLAQIVLHPALMVGFYLVAHKLQKGEGAEFSQFFRGFDWVGQLSLQYLVQVILLIFPIGLMAGTAMVLGANLVEDGPEVWMIILIALMLIPLMYFAIAWSWAPLFIVFYGMEFWEAMETSRKLITPKWGTFFGFSLVLGLITMGGMLILFVGIFAALPIVACASYAAFADITGLHETSEDEITEHLVM